MKKIIVVLMVAVFMVLLVATGVEAANTVSYGTIGTGATATGDCSAVELYTPAGLTTSGYVRLEIPEGIELGEIASLSYTAKITDLGPANYPGLDTFAPEVVINIDADGDGPEGTGIEWMRSSYDPDTLSGDNFLSGDYWPPDIASPDSDFVNRDALIHYYYWSANDTRTGFGSFWAPWLSIVPGMLPVHGIDATDMVYSIDFVVGTSGNFDGMRVLFSEVELNGVTYPVVSPTKACVLIGSGVPGKGLEDAPGLQKPFNPKSQAAEHAGKKK